MKTNIILPSCYLPPISWFAAYINDNESKNIIIEKFEHFPKQTFRNRANILSPNGVLPLTIPVVKGSKCHTSMKDVKISYESNWQNIHWKSLECSYRSSAYFEYFEDIFAPFYQEKEKYLFDFNEKLITEIFKCLKINTTHSFTDSYIETYPQENNIDLRNNIHPKKDSIFTFDTYYQAFAKEKPFYSDLSILDLLFNQGNRSIDIIKSAKK